MLSGLEMQCKLKCIMESIERRLISLKRKLTVGHENLYVKRKSSKQSDDPSEPKYFYWYATQNQIS